MQNKTYKATFPVLLVLLSVVLLASMSYGAVNISLDEIISGLRKYLYGSDDLNLNERIFMEIRLPRAILCVFVGATGGGRSLDAGFIPESNSGAGACGNFKWRSFWSGSLFCNGCKF